MKKNQTTVMELEKAVAELEETREIEPVMLLKVEDLIFPEFKTRSAVNEKSLANLTENIRSAGLISPILVRRKENKYEIISGVKRVLVMQALGNTLVRAFIIEKCDDKKALLLSISDNLNRDDLNIFDQVYSMVQLMSITLKKTPEEVRAILNRLDNLERGKAVKITNDDKEAERVISGILAKFGKLKINSFILKLKVLDLFPALVEAVREKGLGYTLALEINKVKEMEKMHKLLNHVLENNVTLKEVKAKVREILGEPEYQNPFHNIYKKAKDIGKMPKEKQQQIFEMIKKLELLMAG